TGGQRRQDVDRNSRPPERRTQVSLGPYRDLPTPTARPGWVHLDQDLAARREERVAAREQPSRIATDTDVAVGEQHMAPAALAGQRPEEAPAQRGGSPAAGLPDRLGRNVHTERGHPGGGERRRQPTRSTAGVQRRPRTTRQQTDVAGRQSG